MINLLVLFKDILPLITKYAPTIGRVLGGAPGVFMSYVLPLLTTSFNSSGDISKLIDNIKNDPDAENKLTSLEQDNSSWISLLMEEISTLSSAEINVKLSWIKPEK